MYHRTRIASLKQQLYNTLREGILTNQLKPGQPLLEDELAGQFGLSRTPVREILAALAHERLVVRTPYAGTAVALISSQDVREFYSIRGALELLALESALSRIPERELDALQAIFAQVSATTEEDQLHQLASRLDAIHDLIVTYTDNRRLQTELRRLQDEGQRVRAIRDSFPGSYDPRLALDEMYEIYESIRSRDIERAGRALLSHWRNGAERIASFFPDAIPSWQYQSAQSDPKP